jgi:hypothetical protein
LKQARSQKPEARRKGEARSRKPEARRKVKDEIQDYGMNASEQETRLLEFAFAFSSGFWLLASGLSFSRILQSCPRMTPVRKRSGGLFRIRKRCQFNDLAVE